MCKYRLETKKVGQGGSTGLQASGMEVNNETASAADLAMTPLLRPVLYQGLTSVGPMMHQYARALAPAIISGPEGRVSFAVYGPAEAVP
jgi:hypothetical protein